MKIPKTFIPYRGIEEKTEQLLVEPKINEHGPTEEDLKEKLLETLVKELESTSPLIRNELTKNIREVLASQGYSNLKIKNPKIEYWIKETEQGCKVFFKSNLNEAGLAEEYGFAYLKKTGHLEEFQKRFEKYASSQRKSILYPESRKYKIPYKSLEYRIGGALSSTVTTTAAIAAYYSSSKPVSTDLATLEAQSFLCVVSIIYSYFIGGMLSSWLSHKINKSKMEKIYTRFTLDEKDALRYALLDGFS